MPTAFVLLWSSAFIAGVIGVGAAPPLLLIAARFAGAGLLMALYSLAVRAPWPRGKNLFHVAISGLLIQAVQFGAFYMALGLKLPAAVIALVQGLNPVVIALLASRMLGERATARQWLGFVIGGLGVLLAVSTVIRVSVLGVVLCVVGLAGLSVGTVYQKRFAPDMDIRTGTATQFLISTPVVALAWLAVEPVHVSKWLPFGLALAWMIAVNSIGAFALLYTLLRGSSASKVGTLFFLTPTVTAVLTWLVVGQTLRPAEIAGLVVAGTGVLLASSPSRQRR